MAIDPEMLERLRRGVPLRLSAIGQLIFDGEPVTHPGVIRALRAGFDLSDAGEPIVRLGPHWCYLTVDETPLRALGVDVEGAEATLRLDDGRRVALDPTTLWLDAGGGLRCTAPAQLSGRPLRVRFSNQAQVDIADAIDLEVSPPRLRLGERAFPLPPAEPA